MTRSSRSDATGWWTYSDLLGFSAHTGLSERILKLGEVKPDQSPTVLVVREASPNDVDKYTQTVILERGGTIGGVQHRPTGETTGNSARRDGLAKKIIVRGHPALMLETFKDQEPTSEENGSGEVSGNQNRREIWWTDSLPSGESLRWTFVWSSSRFTTDQSIAELESMVIF